MINNHYSLEEKKLLSQERLGVILKKAKLISEYQLQLALQDQNRLNQIQDHHIRIGEVLALRGWIRQKTADFFGDTFPSLVMSIDRYKIGFYLLWAGLLEKDQVEIILNEQKKLPMKFGLIAAKKKWINLETINFFVKCFQYPSVIYPLAQESFPDLRNKLNQKISNRLEKFTYDFELSTVDNLKQDDDECGFSTNSYISDDEPTLSRNSCISDDEATLSRNSCISSELN